MEPFAEKGIELKVHLFNCDRTYKLDTVESLLKAVEAKTNAKYSFLVKKHYFPVTKMIETCAELETYEMDFAVFVVHANESRLSINEEKAGIGYAKLYRTLLRATGNRVLIVIGGDENYEGEEDTQVLSRWAKLKILSQFSPEYLDGRKSFIFSWEIKHRLIHEDALLHFLGGTGQKFIPVVRPLRPIESQRKLAAAGKQQTHDPGTVSPFQGNKPPSFEAGRPQSNLADTKDTQILQPSRREEEKEPLLQRVDETEKPSVSALILCHHVDEHRSIDVVISCFRQVMEMFGWKVEISSSYNVELSLNVTRSEHPDYVVLLVAKDTFEREMAKVNSLLEKSERLAGSRSFFVICKDREWMQNQYMSESVEQRFSHGKTLIISWNEDHPEFSYQAHAKYLEMKLKESKGHKETKVKMEDVLDDRRRCQSWFRSAASMFRSAASMFCSCCLWFWGIFVSCFRWIRGLL